MLLIKIFFIFGQKTFTPEDPDAPWYEEAAVGKNTLSVMVKEMCAEAGIDKKTNHSLRALEQTFLKRSSRGQQATGLSIEALRTHKQVSTEQQKHITLRMPFVLWHPRIQNNIYCELQHKLNIQYMEKYTAVIILRNGTERNSSGTLFHGTDPVLIRAHVRV